MHYTPKRIRQLAENFHEFSYRKNQPLLYRLDHWEQLKEILISFTENNIIEFENYFVFVEHPEFMKNVVPS